MLGASPRAMRFPWLLTLVFPILFCMAGAASAQTVTGTIQGTVKDSGGGVLPGAMVTITNAETGAERSVVTNEGGFYTAPFIQIGRYTVKATMSGFGAVARQNIEVGVNVTRVVDFSLEPRVTSEVTVTSELPRINSTTAEIKSSLTAEQIFERPTLNSSNFLEYATTFPGFQENPTSGQNNPTSSSGSSINFNNTGTRGATFQINGVNNDDSSENQNRQGAALATIQEFAVLKNGYSAEFGRGDGAVVLVQTKSGTNRLRGDAYMYKQDGAWNARTFFASPTSPKPDRQRTQTGFTAGFPIAQNRLFAFVNADVTKLDGENPYTRDIILPSDINVPWLTRGNDTPANRAFIQSVLDRFPSFMVPNDSRSPRTYTDVFGINWPDYDYSGRADWNMRGGQTLTGRYQWTHQLRENEEVIVGEQTVQDNTQQNFGATWTHILSNAIVGEFRYGLGVRSTNVNIFQGNDTPIIRFGGPLVAGSGSIIGNAGAFPINRDQTDHQFVYNLTAQILSSHSVRVGTDIRRQKLDDVADNFSRGFWSFTNSCGGTTYANAYAAFFDGCVNSFQKGYGPFFLENRMSEANFYVQDDWRIANGVTLNLGLRYEYVSAPTEKEDRVDYVYGADSDNIQPRVGIAYAPQWESGFLRTLAGAPGNMAFQAGYGIYDGRIFQSVFSQGGANVRFNPPNALFRNLTTLPNILSLADPSLGFVFTPGPQTARTTITLPDENLEMPSTKKWNLSFERGLPWNSTLKVSYQGNHNDKRLKYALGNLPVAPPNSITVVDHPFNQPAAGFPDLRGKTINAIAADFRCAGTGLPGITTNATCPVNVPIADNEISLRVPRTNERRPDPLYTTNLLISNDAESWYDGLEITWDKRFSRGLQFNAAYTWSNSEDTNSEATFVGAGDSNQLGPNAAYARAKSRFHVPHRFTLSGSYQLPFFQERQDWVGHALGGWTISGILKLASGTPFTVTFTGTDLDFDGFAEARPVVLDRSVLYRSIDEPATAQELLPRSAFRPQVYGDTVDMLVPRNSFYGDGFENVDLALAKTFRLPWGGDQFSVRLEAFNAFNQVQFAFPISDFNNAAFGAINGVQTSYSPRTIQLRLWYRY